MRRPLVKHLQAMIQRCTFFDANNDGAPDLYVASGGYHAFGPADAALQDRLYLNDGTGRLSHVPDALPADMLMSSAAVTSADVNGDGFDDLFVGGGVVPGRYPESPASYVLLNRGDGAFEVVVDVRLGMVRDAIWHDLDGDGSPELVVAGLWMPLSVYTFAENQLQDVTDQYFEARFSGLWNTLTLTDLNNDGIMDLVAGNMGRNSEMKAGPETPASLYFADFNNDGAIDPLLDFYVQGVAYPFLTLDELRRQLPNVAGQFRSYSQFAGVQTVGLFGSERLGLATRLEANHMETMLFLGGEDGTFKQSPLPIEVQFSSIHAVLAFDYDDDGAMDLLMAGNTDDGQIRLGRYDASYGMLLRGDGNGQFEYVPQDASGFAVRGAVRSLVARDGTILFGINGAPIVAYRSSGF